MINFNCIAIRDYYPTKENPGNSIWVYEQVKGLMNYGINSFVISPTPYIPNFLRKKRLYYLYPKHNKKIENYSDTYVIRPPYIKLPSKHFFKLNLLFQRDIINKYSQGIDARFIHAHFGKNGIASISLKKRLNIPLVTYFYGEDVGILEHAQKLKKLYKKLFVYGDLFIALSEDMKSDMIAIGFPENKVIVHHLGIDVNLFKSENEKKTRDKIVICSVGRFHENKGGQDTIIAFSKLLNEYRNIELRIVGDGPYLNNLKKLCVDLNIMNNVYFINNFKTDNPREIVLDEMKNSDIFILTPYLINNGMKTGTPVVLMEAQALGIPCISTNYAGIPEVLNFGKSGIIVEQRNIDQISDAMRLLCANEDIRKNYSKLARKHMEVEFNQEKQIEKLSIIYKNICRKYNKTF